MKQILEKKVFDIIAEGKGPNYTAKKIIELLFPKLRQHIEDSFSKGH